MRQSGIMSIEQLTEGRRFTVPEVAKRLDVHVSAVWRWVFGGVRGQRLRTVKIGARRFVYERDLLDFIERSSAVPGDEPAAEPEQDGRGKRRRRLSEVEAACEKRGI